MSQNSARNSLERGKPFPLNELYEFGPFRIDVARHEITRADTAIALAPKAFDLLMVLLRAGGRAVSRDELMATLWPDTFVEESNLSFQVWALRKALGQDGDKWVQTVPRHGYRLAAAARTGMSSTGVGAGHAAVVARSDATFTSVGGGARWRGPAGWLAFAVLAMAVIAATALSRMRDTARPAETILGTLATPLAQFPNTEGAPSFSPDGSQIAFEWDGAETAQFDIYAMVVGQGAPLRLTHDETKGEHSPAWSPDGARIAFVRGAAASVPEVWVMAALGGSERRLTAMALHGAAGMQAGLLAWSQDGRWVAAGGVRDGQRGIHLLEVDGPGRRLLTQPADGQTDYGPAFSADGRFVTFIRSTFSWRNAIMVMPLAPDLAAAGPAVTVVDPAPQHAIDVVWAPDGYSLIYSLGNHLGSSRLERLRLADSRLAAMRPPERLPFGHGVRGLDVTRSGRLAYSVMFRDSSFWTLDLDNPSAGLKDANLLRSTVDDHTPDYSPDGRQLVFASTRTGSEELWVATADGIAPRQVTFMGGVEVSFPRWSPDGRRIAFHSNKEGSFDVYLLDPLSGEIHRVTSAPGNERHPRWSRDGTRLYYSSDASGRPQIWKLPASGGEAVQVTTNGGVAAEESVDGRVLYVGKWDGGRPVCRVSLAGREEAVVATGLNNPANFAVGRQAIYAVVVGSLPHHTSVTISNITTGHRQTIPFGKGMWQGVALAPDERTLLVSAIDTEGNKHGSDLMIVEHGDARERGARAP